MEYAMKESVVNTAVDFLKRNEIDGESMQEILERVSLEEQIFRQLYLSAPKEKIKALNEEYDRLWGVEGVTEEDLSLQFIEKRSSEEFIIEVLNKHSKEKTRYRVTYLYEDSSYDMRCPDHITVDRWDPEFEVYKIVNPEYEAELWDQIITYVQEEVMYKM